MAYLKPITTLCAKCQKRKATVWLYTQYGQLDHAYCKPCGELACQELNTFERQHTAVGAWLARREQQQAATKVKG